VKKLQLTVFLNEADRIGEAPLYEEVLRRLQHAHVSGATVVLGWMGYGKHGLVHRKGLFGVSDDRPVMIVAVEDEAVLRPLLPRLKEIVIEGMITLHEVEAL
jgi:PII-like signaling protein